MEKINYSMNIGVNVEASELDKTEAQLKRIVDLLERINNSGRITITDSEGNLRCVLGPLDIEQKQVFNSDTFLIQDASIAGAIITNAKALKTHDDALKSSIREVVKELLDKEGRPGGSIWRAIKNF